RDTLLDRLESLGDRLGARAPLLRTLRVQERVPEHPEQVAEVVLAPQEPRPREHARVGVLDQVLCILARPRERPGCPVEAIEVIAERGRVEPTRHPTLPPRSPCVLPPSIERRSSIGGNRSAQPVSLRGAGKATERSTDVPQDPQQALAVRR